MPNVNAGKVLTTTILSGQSLSGAVQIAGLKVLALITPAAMTGGGSFTFQVSPDGVTYYELNDAAGNPVTSTAIATSTYYDNQLAGLLGINYLKVRSGTSGTPIVQAADRAIGVLVGT